VHHGRSGTWWGTDPVNRRTEEIDVVLTVTDGELRIGWFAECKYKNERTGNDVIEQLRQKVRLVKGYDERHLVIYSQAGFADDIRGGDVELYTLDDVLSG